MKSKNVFTTKCFLVSVLTLCLASFVMASDSHAEKRKVRREKKKSEAGATEPKLQSFGTCRESEYYTKPLNRKYEFLELLSDGRGRVVLRKRLAEPRDLQAGLPPSSSDPATYSDQHYRYSAAGSNWADELPMPLAMFGRECSAQYESSNKDFFEVTKLSHPASGPVRMPGAHDDGKVDYALTTVQDHTHVRVNFTCRMDLMNNPLRCEKPDSGRGAGRRQNHREGGKLLDTPMPSEENGAALPAGGSQVEGAR